MAVRSYPTTAESPSAPAERLLFGRYSTIHAGAIIAHGLSYVTTLWFVQWVAPDLALTAQGIAAYFTELLLFAMKSALWNSTVDDDGVGWAGVIIDAVLNAGGILPRADTFLTFPPLAAALSVAGVRVADLAPVATLPDGTGVSAAGLIAALLGGILLSAAPHRMWRAASKRK